MATYDGTPSNDTINVVIPYANPGFVNEKAYGNGGDDAISIRYEDIQEEWGWSNGAYYSGLIEIYGGDGDDYISNDALYEEHDYIPPDIDDVVNRFYGEDGNDTLVCSYSDYRGYYLSATSIEYLYGGTGDDTYVIAEDSDEVIERTGEGTDTVRAMFTESFASNIVIMPNVENLVLESVDGYFWGSAGAAGNALDNRIVGNEIQNELNGGAGNDTLFGKSAGEDNLWEYNDADIIRGGTGNDLIYGGGGDTDTWDGDDSLYGDDGNDKIFGSFGNDLMYGGTGNDELGGQAGNDTMYGGTGNDKLGGGSGNDLLYGDADADVLAGREGLDRLTGGTGNDVFDYDAVTDSRPGSANRDVILDFVGVGAAVGDRIDLLTIDANTSAGGNQAFAFRGTASFTKAGQVRVLASGSDTLIQANTGGSLAPELEILVKDGTATPAKWVAGDFIL